jgi:hypothetical protein
MKYHHTLEVKLSRRDQPAGELSAAFNPLAIGDRDAPRQS